MLDRRQERCLADAAAYKADVVHALKIGKPVAKRAPNLKTIARPLLGEKPG
jgi:hypothetical protein